MESELTLCDTDVIIEYFKKNLQVLQMFSEIGYENLFINVITKTELIQGAENKTQMNQITKRIDRFMMLDIDTIISQKYAEIFEAYYLSHKCKIPDAIIAATALVYDVKLFTLNIKDFKFYKNIRLVRHNIKPVKT